VIAVTSKNILHAGIKYPIRGSIDIPTAQNMKDPIPIHERYLSDVNSVSIAKLVQFRNPVENVDCCNIKTRNG
jgi:hypothetical protein